MLDLKQYDSVGAALRGALDLWPDEVCLIEVDRERERSRLTYRQFREAAEPLAAALEDSGFAAGERAAIIMTNQPKWLISAYATFFAGGVLVPLDYRLSADEHLQLLALSKARLLFVEYPHWRAITRAKTFREHKLQTILVTEAPPNADLAGGLRWEEYRAARAPAK
jgi:feruloyl-CoA synthase